MGPHTPTVANYGEATSQKELVGRRLGSVEGQWGIGCGWLGLVVGWLRMGLLPNLGLSAQGFAPDLGPKCMNWAKTRPEMDSAHSK